MYSVPYFKLEETLFTLGLSIYYVTGRGGTFFFLVGKIGHDRSRQGTYGFFERPWCQSLHHISPYHYRPLLFQEDLEKMRWGQFLKDFLRKIFRRFAPVKYSTGSIFKKFIYSSMYWFLLFTWATIKQRIFIEEFWLGDLRQSYNGNTILIKLLVAKKNLYKSFYISLLQNYRLWVSKPCVPNL